MAAQTAAGTSLAISIPLPATEDEAGYSALEWNNIGEIESLGGTGIEFNEVTFTALDNRRERKFKGSYSGGSPTVTVAIDANDQGQQDCRAMLMSDDDAAFRRTAQDGSVRYFRAKVMSFNESDVTVEDIYTADIDLGINSDIVDVAPAPAT